MDWIFPMAGRGKRTNRLGEFKPFIEVNGRRLIEWALLGVREQLRPSDRLVFITTRYFAEKYKVAEVLDQILKSRDLSDSFKLILAEETPEGPAASVYLAAQELSLEQPCVVVNSDQFTVIELPNNWGAEDGFCSVYFNTTPESCYFSISDGLIVSVHEKKMVSHYASSGIYGFGSARNMLQAFEDMFAAQDRVNGEYYVGPAMNYLLARGGEVHPARTLAKFDLGNEKGIKRFTSLGDGVFQ